MSKLEVSIIQRILQTKINLHSPIHSSIIITDPNAEEESLSNDQVTVAIVDGEICLVHKPGGAALSANQLEACLKQALDREKKVVQLLAQVLKK